MFTYTVNCRAIQPTLLTGFRECLKDVSAHNPGWGFQVVEQEGAHLSVLDFTTYETLASVAPNDILTISDADASKALVMLTASQSGLALQLMKYYRCSLLCVDERHLRLRELVECSLKKRRYISPRFRHLDENTEHVIIPVRFTGAEMNVLNGLRNGKSGVEISQELFRSQKTISSHKRKIMKKLGVTNNIELRKAIMGMSKVS